MDCKFKKAITTRFKINNWEEFNSEFVRKQEREN